MEKDEGSSKRVKKNVKAEKSKSLKTNGKKSIEKVSNEKKIRFLDWGNILIQIITGAGIIATFYINYEFNRSSLRPVIYVSPLKGIEIGNNFVRIAYHIENLGQTSAYKIELYSTLTEKIDFPLETFKVKIKKEKKKDFKEEIYLPRNQKYFGKSNQIQIINLTDKESIIKKLEETEVSCHFYISYYDNRNRKFFLKSSFTLTDLGTQEKETKKKEGEVIIDCNWMPRYASEEPL